MTFLKNLLMVAFSIFLTACASNGVLETKTIVQNVSLKGSELYIYSFLDVRENAYRSAMLKEFDSQLVAALASSGVKANLIRFKNSIEGRNYVERFGAVKIPVRETIIRNIENEHAEGTRYRLIIMPVGLRYQDWLQYYQIDWTLVDAMTGAEIWTATSTGALSDSPINKLLTKGDIYESQAKFLVDGIIQEMQTSKLLQ